MVCSSGGAGGVPELPEVETTRHGIDHALSGRRVLAVHIRNPRLRYPVPPDLALRQPQTLFTGCDGGA